VLSVSQYAIPRAVAAIINTLKEIMNLELCCSIMDIIYDTDTPPSFKELETEATSFLLAQFNNYREWNSPKWTAISFGALKFLLQSDDWKLCCENAGTPCTCQQLSLRISSICGFAEVD
jgi:hypothetical protein